MPVPSSPRDATKATPKYMALAAGLRRDIECGALIPGDRLPSFAEMRAAHGVTPTTIERVHKVLEADGLIERRHGSGIFVARPATRPSSDIVGFVRLTTDQPQEFGMHLYGGMLQDGAMDAARKHGLSLMLLDEDAPESAWHKLDGVLTTKRRVPPGLPCVQLLAAESGVVAVAADEAAGIHDAVLHLVELGHRRIAFLLSDTEPFHSSRLNGYHRALIKSGLQPDRRWIRHLQKVWEHRTSFVGAAAHGMRAWLTEDWEQLGCTALLCQNDQAAIGVIEALRDAGLSVPGDVSVVGFDGTEAAEYARPRLTTVEVPLFEIGACGMDALAARLRGGKAESRVLPTRLRIGASTGPVRAGEKARTDQKARTDEKQRTEGSTRAVGGGNAPAPGGGNTRAPGGGNTRAPERS